MGMTGDKPDSRVEVSETRFIHGNLRLIWGEELRDGIDCVVRGLGCESEVSVASLRHCGSIHWSWMSHRSGSSPESTRWYRIAEQAVQDEMKIWTVTAIAKPKQLIYLVEDKFSKRIYTQALYACRWMVWEVVYKEIYVIAVLAGFKYGISLGHRRDYVIMCVT